MPNEEPPRRRSLGDALATRSTVDIMILVLVFVVSVSILATGATVAVIEIAHPESDTTTVVESLTSTITGIIGALLGLIAGRSEASKPPGP
jgi:hypothetical protein